jgi:hypothetical protein
VFLALNQWRMAECLRARAASAARRLRFARRGTARRLPRPAVAVSTSTGARVVQDQVQVLANAVRAR